jgi:hypothetical protein
MSIAINTTNPNNILAINCGTSTPRLSGSVDITSFPNLTSFICIENDITAFSALDPIPSLAVLALSGNKLSGNFDANNIPNIVFLDISNNSLSAIDTATNLNSLVVLKARYNQFKNNFNATRFPNLTSLDLYWNGLTALPIFSIGNKIENLNLYYNPIVSDCDLSLIPNIKDIDVQYNYNTRLTNYGPLTGIEVIDARDTIITGLETLTNKPNIRVINFAASTANRYISLSGQFPLNLSNLTQLEELFINNSSLSGTEAVNLSGCDKLQYLRIQQNALTGPHPILPPYSTALLAVNIQGNPTRQRLTGNIPPLSSFPNLFEYTGSLNNFSGEIPTLDYNPNLQTFSVGGVNSSNRGSLTKINSLSGAINLLTFSAGFNALSGSIPSLNGLSALNSFTAQDNSLSGEIPSLNDCKNLTTFRVDVNRLTKINSLSGATKLATFQAFTNALSGDLPYLGNNTALVTFQVQTNSLSGGTIGPVLSSFATFNASSNILSQSTVHGILSSFAAAGRNSGTRVLNIGTNNAAPDFTTNCVKLTSARMGFITNWPANTFTRPANSFTVTARVSGHGFNQGDIITINNIGTGFNTTSPVLNVANVNQFTYTSPTSAATVLNSSASTTGRIYKTLTSNTPLSSYQRLTLPTNLGGLGWTTTIVFQQ